MLTSENWCQRLGIPLTGEGKPCSGSSGTGVVNRPIGLTGVHRGLHTASTSDSLREQRPPLKRGTVGVTSQ